MVPSEYLAALRCTRPRFLILSCSAYLACVQSWVCNEASRLHLSPCGWTDRCPKHPSTHTVSGGGVGCVTLFVPLTRTHTQTPVCVPPTTPTCAHHMHVRSCSGGGVVKYGTLIQVALTDLEDVVDGAGQRPAHGGYL